MFNYYPSHRHILNKYKDICAEQTGILDSQIIMQANSIISKNLNTCAAIIPAYHKILLGEDSNISYHLAGYGIYRDEAIVRLLGEGLERYALLISNLYFKNKLKYASYMELKKNEPDKVIPWEYIKLYNEEDYKKLSKFGLLEDVTENDVISWVLLPSLFNKKKEYYIPAQSFFLAYKHVRDKNEKHAFISFSKGTATHINVEKALKAAISEIVECDGCMIKWYTGSKVTEVILDDNTLNKTIGEVLKDIDYTVRVFDYTINYDLGYVFTVVLINNKDKTPYIVMGAASSLNPVKAVYRAFVEAAAILTLNINGPLAMPNDYLESKGKKNYINLDSNVYYWSTLEDKEKKLALLDGMVAGKKTLSGYKNYEVDDEEDLLFLIKGLYNISKYAVYADITPVEIEDKDLKVMRIYVPELLQMSFPAFPYGKHPRMISNGGVKNEFPHPLP